MRQIRYQYIAQMGIWYSLPARKYGDDMAEINTRLHYKLNGVTDEIKCYTTLAEVQNQGIPVKVGGVVGYAKYGPASDANASRGNYKPPGGTAQRILKAAQLPYGEKAYTTPGTYTFTVPNGIKKIRIAVVGGGGGNSADERWYGGTSSVGNLIQATGGQDAYGVVLAGDDRGTSAPGKGGTPNGVSGKMGDIPGTGWKLNFDKKVGEYGRGAVRTSGDHAGAGGGGYNTGYFTVSPGQTLTCIVGRFSNWNYSGPRPTDGFVLIAWGGDIQ